MSQKGYIDFTPLFWFGVIVGVGGSIVAYSVIKALIAIISHLEWV
jgi:hypothetical protein